MRLKDFQEGIKQELQTEVRSELRFELHSLFEQYFGQTPFVTVTGVMSGKGKGLLGESPPGFPTREHLVVSPMANVGHVGESSRRGTVDAVNSSFRVDFPHFNDGDFKGWWSKLEQYFESKRLGDHAKVRVVMLHFDTILCTNV